MRCNGNDIWTRSEVVRLYITRMHVRKNERERDERAYESERKKVIKSLRFTNTVT